MNLLDLRNKLQDGSISETRFPADVISALQAFTEEELSRLTYFVSYDGQFAGVGIVANGAVTQFGEPRKAAALAVLDQKLRQEWEALRKEHLWTKFYTPQNP